MDTISLIVSIITLIFTLVIFFLFDKKIKNQEKKINDYQLEKIYKEKKEEKKAILNIKQDREENGVMKLRILNIGKNVAKNINIKFNPSDFNEMFLLDIFPFPYLNSNDSIDVTMFLSEEMPEIFEITLIWDDDIQENNIYKQLIKL